MFRSGPPAGPAQRVSLAPRPGPRPYTRPVNVERRVVEVAEEVLGPSAASGPLEADSLALAELALALEERLGIVLPEDGAYATLEAVVRHYNDVPKALREYDVSQLDPMFRDLVHDSDIVIHDILSRLDFRLLTQLELTDDEIDDLVAFLRSLTDPAAVELGSLVPEKVPSGLPVDR
jgi:acyl carrier protein